MTSTSSQTALQQQPHPNRRNYGAGLDKVTSFEMDRSKDGQLALESSKLRHWRLREVDTYFARFFSDKQLLADIDGWIRIWPPPQSKTACMIIGLLICDGGNVSETRKRTNHIQTTCTLPVVTAVSTAFGVPPLGIGDPSIKFGRGTSTESSFRSTLSEPKIIGVEYRWIYYRPFSKEPRLKPSGPVTA